MGVVRKKSFEMKRAGGDKPSRRSSTPTAKVALPTEISTPSGSLGDYSMLLYGEKKIGKTSLASKFPEALFLMTEPGAKALSIFQSKVENWAEFKAFVQLLKVDTRFQTVVVDIVDLLYDMCFEHICNQKGIDHPSEETWGSAWKDIKKEFLTELTTLASIGKGVIFISHSVKKEIKKRGGDGYHVTSPTMSGQARDALEGLVDIWAYYSYDGSERSLTIQGDDHVGAGHRLEGRFKYTDGSAIEAIPMGKSAAQAYRNYVQAFENNLKAAGGDKESSTQKSSVVRKVKKTVK